MNQIDRNKIFKMIGILALVFAFVGVASYFRRTNSMTLDDYAKLHPAQTTGPQEEDRGQANGSAAEPDAGSSADHDQTNGSTAEPDADGSADHDQTNGSTAEPDADGSADHGETNAADFYAAPLSDEQRQYVAGLPAEEPADWETLRYVHVLHYNFEGVSTEGELICNAVVAHDLLEIFYELYRNQYQIEKIALPGTDLSVPPKQEPWLAVDINPLYNPCVTYDESGARTVIPAEAQKYADRSADFPYKIDEHDLCYKLFTEHGFVWGGNHNSAKNYGRFQKTLP